jgi:hypothetical protein
MTSKASATPDPQTGGTDNVALLIDLLKLATFIAGPMRDGVAEPLALSSNDLRVILALGGEGELAGHDCPKSWECPHECQPRAGQPAGTRPCRTRQRSGEPPPKALSG